MPRPSSLAWVLMLLLSRVAGDINSSNSSSEKKSLNSSTELPTVLETSTSVTDATSDELQRSLRFEPPFVDFGEACPVGTARAHTVTLLNQNVNRSVYLTSVSGRTPTFYSSFFESKVVPPQGNTTFNVVFLPRMQGIVATDLLIHTSFGQARLQVRGKGRDCPYRLKPLVGIKAPLNATLTPEIQMYNPHSKPIQILEVYSSGGLFQLELPSGGQEGPQTLWEIPPYETKSVIRIRFHARTVGNHTAYIRIKISDQVQEGIGDTVGTGGNVLVIPVEFEILPLHGLYADNPVINFGRFSTKAGGDVARGNSIKPIQFKLHLHSSHMRQQYELLDITLRNITGLTFDPKDGVVILDADAFNSTTILDELMVLRSIPREPLQDIGTQSPHEFTILIRAELFKGSLHYDINSTTFITQATLGTRGGNKRSLVLRNDYEKPLALLNVSLPQDDIGSRALRAQFSSDYLDAIADSPSGSLVLPPGSSLALLQLQMLNSSMTYKANLRIHTNITHIELPLVVCGGRLHVSTYDTGRIHADGPYSVDLNLGAIPLAETSHDGYIVLRNRNPLPVKLNTWNFLSPQGVYFHTTFRGCLRPASLRALRNTTLKLENAKFRLCTQLEEDDVAVFEVAIQSYITEQHQCTLKVWTAYEEITITVRFRTWIGKLEVDQEQLYFNNCFPGKQCSAELAIRSTFQHSIHITSINFTDAGLHFEDYNVNGSTIEGNAMTKVGRIHVNPSLFCQSRCYIPQDERTNILAFPAPSNTRGGLNNNLHFDETELRRRTQLFRHLKYDFQNIVFTLNSHELRQFLLQLIIDIEWPKFVTEKPVLPTIEVGKPHEVQVLLKNPAETPVLLDYFLADPSYAKETELSLPLEVVDIVPHCYLTDKNVFSLLKGAPRQPVLLQPKTSLSVTVRLNAPVADTYCTLLHIRNNLTLYEAVWVSAKVVESEFRLGNRKPGSNVSLTFNFTEKHFSICNPSSTHQHTPSDHNGVGALKYPKVLLKRKFTARNTGEIPIWIESFQIGDQMCSGYGFRIVDCNSFALKANETKKIEIIFTPDYTMHRIMVPLKILTNLSYNVEYTMVAQLPPGTIDQCSVLVRRPEWEERIRSAAIVVLATTFVFVLIAAHIDYDNILHSQTALYEARDKGSVHPTFNLRNIALKAQAATHAPEDEPQVAGRLAANVQPTRCGGIHSQHPKGNTSSSSSSSGSSGSSANSNNSVKKRSIKRQNNSYGNTTSSRVSLPWSLDLNVFKNSVPLPKTTSENDKANSSSGPSGTHPSSGSENSGKKSTSTSTQPKTNTHSDKLDRSNSGGSNSNSNTTGKKQQIQVATTPPQVQTSPPKQQQTRGARKAKSSVAVTVPVAVAEKSDKEPPSGSGANQKERAAPVNNSGSTKNARSNTNKSTVGEGLIQMNAKSSAPDTGTSAAPMSTPSPPSKDLGAQSSSSGAKYGKTPGRERRKDAQNASSTNIGNDVASTSANTSRRAERRSRQRAVNALRALNFADTPATAVAATRMRTVNGNDNGGVGGLGAAGGVGGLLGCLSSPWDTCQATFSDVLQAQPVGGLSKNVSKANDKSNLDISDSKSALFFADNEKGTAESESDFTNKEVQQQTTFFGQNSAASSLDQAVGNSTELGPIGSKKSPSSTPVWEPVHSSGSSSGSSNHSGNGLQIPKPIVSTGDCSFFSDLLTTYEYEGNRQIRGMDADLYEAKKARNEYFEYIYNLRQQQLQAQVQAHVQAQQQQLMQGVDWARLNSRTWSPMAYLGQHDTPGLSNAPLATTVTNPSPCAALMSGLSAPIVGGGNTGATGWPIAGGIPSSSNVVNGGGGPTIIRPPPGLESNFQGINNTQAVAQQQQQQQSPNVPSTDGGSTITADMQTFDPFSSLSSIWSDSWQKRNNSNNSNTNNGNMK